MSAKLVIGNKNYSSWSLRSWFLLTEARIDFEEERLAMDTEGFAGKVAQYSPACRVPVLILDDQPVWDTMAIAETVAERWPEKQLWPSDANVRAQRPGRAKTAYPCCLSEAGCELTGYRPRESGSIQRQIRHFGLLLCYSDPV